MKNFFKLLSKIFSNIKNLFIRKKNSSTINAFNFSTNEHDWEQHNDNVSF